MRNLMFLLGILVFWIAYGIFVNALVQDQFVTGLNSTEVNIGAINTTFTPLTNDWEITYGNSSSVQVAKIPIIGWVYDIFILTVNIGRIGVFLIEGLLNIISFIIIGIPGLPAALNVWIIGINYILSLFSVILVYKTIKGDAS